MPEKFTASVAERLNGVCAMEVRGAKDGDLVLPGLALVAPGNFQILLALSGAQYTVLARPPLCSPSIRSLPPCRVPWEASEWPSPDAARGGSMQWLTMLS